MLTLPSYCFGWHHDCKPINMLSTGNPFLTVLDDLQSAFCGERNARSQYLAFAQRAEKDGRAAIAALFRSVASAESVHANNHAELIRKFGANPCSLREKPIVRSTRENLAHAVLGERHERDSLYPMRITRANAAREAESLRTFILAAMAEACHAKLFTEALQSLDTGAEVRGEYLVCPICGNVTFDMPPPDAVPSVTKVTRSFIESIRLLTRRYLRVTLSVLVSMKGRTETSNPTWSNTASLIARNEGTRYLTWRKSEQ